MTSTTLECLGLLVVSAAITLVAFVVMCLMVEGLEWLLCKWRCRRRRK